MSDIIMLFVENKNLINCEFEYNLQEKLFMKSNHKCALLECVIPQDIKVDQFQYGRKIYLNLVWSKDFKMTDFIPVNKESMYFDFETSDDFHDVLVEFEIGPKIDTLEEFLVQINQILRREIIKDYMQTFYNQRFEKAYVNDGRDIKMPSLEYKNSSGKFQNNIGKIFYSGVKYERAKKFINESKLEKMKVDDAYLYDIKIGIQREAIAHVFFTFDEKLHNIMGYDPDKFPNIILKYDDNHEYMIQHNNGLSTRKCVINELDTFYLHSNIVKESFCSDKKENILQIFKRKYNSSEKSIVYIFDNPLFIPINTREINSISFKITNKFGDIAIVNEETISLKIVFKDGTF